MKIKMEKIIAVVGLFATSSFMISIPFIFKQNIDSAYEYWDSLSYYEIIFYNLPITIVYTLLSMFLMYFFIKLFFHKEV